MITGQRFKIEAQCYYGTVMLDASNPIILEGNYFTGRKSRGSMKFEAVK